MRKDASSIARLQGHLTSNLQLSEVASCDPSSLVGFMAYSLPELSRVKCFRDASSRDHYAGLLIFDPEALTASTGRGGNYSNIPIIQATPGSSLLGV